MSSKLSTAFAAALVLTVFAFTASHSTEMSNFFLPGHVETEEGQISLFADYGSVRTDGRVPVYLVNRTSNDLVLNTQDGDIYLKLQYQDTDGNWVRAQPHAYSWCGNSYVKRTLQSRHYLLVNGFQPINGDPRTIRYELYSQEIALSSNTGLGVVLEQDIERASSDVMSVHEGSFEYVSRVALSTDSVQNNMDHMRDLREMAIWELVSERFDPARSREVLEEVREKNPAMLSSVDRAIRKLDQKQIGQSTR